MKTLEFVVSQMTDFEPEWTHIHIHFGLGDRLAVLAQHCRGEITVFPVSICVDLRERFGKGLFKRTDLLVGKEILRQAAHEFRHAQQELLAFDTDIPSVLLAHQENAALGLKAIEQRTPEEQQEYWDDPGEKDARDFAEKCVQNAPLELLQELEAKVHKLLDEHFDEYKHLLPQ